MIIRVQARDLLAGDVLIPTGRTVVAGASVGVSTPPGKVDLTLRRDVGSATQTKPACFGARTQITVERKDA